MCSIVRVTHYGGIKAALRHNGLGERIAVLKCPRLAGFATGHFHRPGPSGSRTEDPHTQGIT